MQANSAHRLFRSAVYSPGLYTEAFNGSITGLEEAYPSYAFGDDLFWAATWLLHAGNDDIRSYNLTYYKEAVKSTMALAFKDLDSPATDINYVNNLALVHAATVLKESSYHLSAQSFIWDWICDDERIKYTRNGRAYYFNSPYLGNTATAAALAAVYIKANRNWAYVADNKALVKGVPSLQCLSPSASPFRAWNMCIDVVSVSLCVMDRMLKALPDSRVCFA
jgi:hypothetical protein